MKKAFSALFLVLLVSTGFAKNPDEKTFIIIFSKSELKENRTTTDYIELSLMNLFQTKSYSGNSDAAILVKVPYGNFDKCQLGDMTIRLNAKSVVSLDEIAFQIIDLDESKSTYKILLDAFEANNQKSKKANKQLKTAPSP